MMSETIKETKDLPITQAGEILSSRLSFLSSMLSVFVLYLHRVGTEREHKPSRSISMSTLENENVR